MVKLREQRITKRTVDCLSAEDKDVVFWDGEVPEFGVRVYPSDGKVYVVQTYLGGKSKRITIGRHVLITADEARRKAALTIARMKQGEDLELAPSGWVVDSARAPYRRATTEGTAGTLHEKSSQGSCDLRPSCDEQRSSRGVCSVALSRNSSVRIGPHLGRGTTTGRLGISSTSPGQG